jgi:hypothetical protein
MEELLELESLTISEAEYYIDNLRWSRIELDREDEAVEVDFRRVF